MLNLSYQFFQLTWYFLHVTCNQDYYVYFVFIMEFYSHSSIISQKIIYIYSNLRFRIVLDIYTLYSSLDFNNVCTQPPTPQIINIVCYSSL